jgi:hypothetical protein
MQFGMISHFLRESPAGLVLVQPTAPSSLESRSHRPPRDEAGQAHWQPGPDDLPAGPLFFHSGFATPYRGVVVSFGRDEYYGRSSTNQQGETTVDHSLPSIAQTPTMNALHELGHVFYLRHQYAARRSDRHPADEDDNSYHADEHDNHDICIMGYRVPNDATADIDFCGRCLLHFAGWNVGVLPPNGTANPVQRRPVAMSVTNRTLEDWTTEL